jgi:hypothetical protein
MESDPQTLMGSWFHRPTCSRRLRHRKKRPGVDFFANTSFSGLFTLRLKSYTHPNFVVLAQV